MTNDDYQKEINQQCGYYNGYGQEDSFSMDKNAIEKGLFRANSLKKYNNSKKKECVIEEVLEDGDILIGEILPFQSVDNSDKIFKDNSEHYKFHKSKIVDTIYTGIDNDNGYEITKLRIRSERIPLVGDMFSSYAESRTIKWNGYDDKLEWIQYVDK